MRKSVSIIMMAFTLSFFGVATIAAPVQWSASIGGNDHWYEYVDTGGTINWWSARTISETSYYNGLRGHLATITSQEEEDFIWQNLTSACNYCAYIGGFQDHGASDYWEPGGGWRWVTGEAWSYTYWWGGNGGEPNERNAFEDFISFFNGPRWNDCQATDNSSYLIEYDELLPVPEPSSIVVLVAGLGSFLAFRRRGR